MVISRLTICSHVPAPQSLGPLTPFPAPSFNRPAHYVPGAEVLTGPLTPFPAP
ncbi:hypothetical protein GS4_05_01480 [Gordonia soli NBRC 108243]|uniref:Uncharacterized protein n=1 Tax=Gordonia soli NBRC 108243 TaxID=1223545 RepID=M0QF65_9ACTN|nr:hypothetical protein GS4_05_01480 [Gordonia soli NBRC 108243]